MPLAKYHSAPYWDFVMNQYHNLHGINLEKELDWKKLAKVDILHTWCNAFVARWEYFDEYMSQFSPIVLSMLDFFGSHPSDLELSYICERLIILFNYIRYSENKFGAQPKITPLRCTKESIQRYSAQIDKEKRLVSFAADLSANQENMIEPSHQELRGAQSMRVNRPPNKPDYSLIVCSIDDRKYANLLKSVDAAFSKPVQVIRIIDAASLAEGYNRGVRFAQGKICIFCHDDIEFINCNMDSLLEEDLALHDIVGVAGTSRLVSGKWIQAGSPYIHGLVAHEDVRTMGYSLCVYGMGQDPVVVEKIQALDGLFFAVNRDVLDYIAFDEALFDGFHLYDLDFTFNAYLKGFKLAVDHRLLLIHQSGGRFDHNWQQYARRFNGKYARWLDPKAAMQRPGFKYYIFKSKETLGQAMQLYQKSRHFTSTTHPPSVTHA
jgi:glycosyltransferase involved in cell wall biosynthesis